ncbi:MAG: DUF2298 domain-containing protein [Halobacteriota archaeon]
METPCYAGAYHSMEVLPIVRWLVLLSILYAAVVPVTAHIWPSFPDRGAAFALPVALVSIGLSAVWIGQLTYGPAVATVAVLLPIVAGAVAFHRGTRPSLDRVIEPYVVFLAGFGLLLAFRTVSPALTPFGGEQFLHFGLMNAVERATALPPEDMWFAGEPVRYYYGGHVTTVSLAIVAGVETRVAYNLALATYYGVLLTGAYGLAGAITAHGGSNRRLGGLLGAFFVAIAGTLTTPVRLAYGLLPRETALAYGKPVFGAIRGDYERELIEQSSISTWSWWDERYVVPETLQEVPLYSFVKADHHGHTITVGFLLLAAALAYAYYLTPAAARKRRLVLLFGALPIVGGFLGVTNTWALPSVPGIAWLALCTAPTHPASLLPDRIRTGLDGRWSSVCAGSVRRELSRVGVATVVAVGIGALSLLLAAPFVFGGTPTNDGIGIFPPRSNLVGFLLLYGGPLLVFATYLRTRGINTGARVSGPIAVSGGSVALLAAAYLLGPGGFPVLVVCAPLLVGGYVLARSEAGRPGDRPGGATDETGFEVTVLLAGVGLLLAMELVHAKVWPPELDRWNTTLKVAIQAWTFTGLAAGIIAARLFDSRLRRLRLGGSKRLHEIGVLAIVAAVVLTSAVFPAMVVVYEDVGSETDRTIDGLADFEADNPDTMAAISWLDDRSGAPVLLEAPTRDSYSWGSTASTYTGVPSVVGWDHQRGYRGDSAFERRADHVDTIYAGDRIVDRELSIALLAAYDVEYIWVGPAERERYDSIRSFEDIDGVDVAFETDTVTVYAVSEERLPETSIPVSIDGEDAMEIDAWGYTAGPNGTVRVTVTVENTADETRPGVVGLEASFDDRTERSTTEFTVPPGGTKTIEVDLDMEYTRFEEEGDLRIAVVG